MFALLLKFLTPHLVPLLMVLAPYEVWFGIPGDAVLEKYSQSDSRATAEKVAKALRASGFVVEVRDKKPPVVGTGPSTGVGQPTNGGSSGSGGTSGGSSGGTSGGSSSGGTSGGSSGGTSGGSSSGGSSSGATGPAQPIVDDYVHLAMGNPSKATTVLLNEDNYLMNKSQYAMSYNRSDAIPNWVSWQLTKKWMGGTTRSDNFRPDPELPSGWYRATDKSYSGSGFTRGHMCPSGDRTANSTDNNSTFLMTNMVPQSANNNNKGWNTLEDYCRGLATAGNELYIICGPYGQGGTGTSGKKQTIDGGKIKVPAVTWKVVVVVPAGSGPAVNRVTEKTRVIAIWMPNDQSVGTDWGKYRKSVDFIEEQTGLDFLSNLPAALQAKLESQVDAGPLK